MRLDYLALSLCLWSAWSAAASPKSHPLSHLPIVARIAVPAGPAWLGVGFGSVWLSKSQNHALYRIDPRTNAILATIAVGPDPELGIGIGLGSVWIADTKEHVIRQIDPASNTVVNRFAVNIADEPEGAIAADAGSLWVLTNENHTESGTLSRIDPKSGRIIANIAVKPHSHAVVVAGDSAWVTNSADASVLRIDVHSNKVTADIGVHDKPRFIDAGAGGIWVLSQGDGSLARIDPATNRVVATIDLGGAGPGGDLWVEDGIVWASADGIPVSMIDAHSNALLAQYTGGQRADTLRASFGSVWVVDDPAGTIWKISTAQLKKLH